MTRLAGGGSAGGAACGSVDGTGSAATFCSPTGVAVTSSGIVYVADRSNNLIRMISPTGTSFLTDCRRQPCRIMVLVICGAIF